MSLADCFITCNSAAPTNPFVLWLRTRWIVRMSALRKSSSLETSRAPHVCALSAVRFWLQAITQRSRSRRSTGGAASARTHASWLDRRDVRCPTQPGKLAITSMTLLSYRDSSRTPCRFAARCLRKLPVCFSRNRNFIDEVQPSPWRRAERSRSFSKRGDCASEPRTRSRSSGKRVCGSEMQSGHA